MLAMKEAPLVLRRHVSSSQSTEQPMPSVHATLLDCTLQLTHRTVCDPVSPVTVMTDPA